MKVLHVEAGRHLYGGARQVLYLVEGLKNAGIENILVAPPGSAIAEAAREHARVIETPLGGDLDIRFVWRLRKHIQREQPDIVHLHSRRGADILGGLAARGSKAKVVLTRRVDNVEPGWSVGPKYRLYDRVITISEAIAGVLRVAGVADDKLRCVPSAVASAEWRSAATRSQLEREFNLCAGLKIVGVAAQFIERKGHRVLFDALPAVTARHPDVHVLLFGQGPLEIRLKRQAAERKLMPHLTFAGFRDDLPRWLGALDLLVHPALKEGLGVILLQAGAAELAAVATRAGGMEEVIVDEQTGLLIPPGDPPSLAVAINSLLDDEALRIEMGHRAAARVDVRYSVPAMIAGNLRVYGELLAGTT